MRKKEYKGGVKASYHEEEHREANRFVLSWTYNMSSNHVEKLNPLMTIMQFQVYGVKCHRVPFLWTTYSSRRSDNIFPISRRTLFFTAHST